MNKTFVILAFFVVGCNSPLLPVNATVNVDIETCRWIGHFDYRKCHIDINGETYLSAPAFDSIVVEHIKKHDTNNRTLSISINCKVSDIIQIVNYYESEPTNVRTNTIYVSRSMEVKL